MLVTRRHYPKVARQLDAHLVLETRSTEADDTLTLVLVDSAALVLVIRSGRC